MMIFLFPFSISLPSSRPKKITLNKFKRGYFVFRDTTLTQYKSQEESHGLPIGRFNLNSKCRKVKYKIGLNYDSEKVSI